jgi:hypothetical protein
MSSAIEWHPLATEVIEERRRRNIKYVMIGFPRIGGFPARLDVIEIPLDTDYNCREAARLWSKTTRGDAYCFCVQDGAIADRAFSQFLG